MNRPGDPWPGDSGREPPEAPDHPGARDEPLLFRVIRSAIAPDVLADGGRDAPLGRRGRIVFWVVVGVLVAAIAVLFLLVQAK